MGLKKGKTYYPNLFDVQLKKFKKKPNKVYVDGYHVGKTEAATLFSNFLDDRMNTLTDIEGVGDKTALKVYQHFMGVLEDEGSTDKYLKAN